MDGKREAGSGKRYADQRWLVVGLGKSGLSAVRHLLREGAEVVATDSRSDAPGADEARAAGARLLLGGFAAPQPYSQFAGLCLSPGIAPQDSFVQEIASAGVEVVGDVELFARALSRIPHSASRSPVVIGITGSNGKSTVTTLVGEMARKAGMRVQVGGNLGTPALDLLRDDAELYVLELSSFQLETTHSLRCLAATVLNLSQDHLDRHGSMQAYAAAKMRIFEGCEIRVVNRDDRVVGTREAGSARRYASFGLSAPREPGDYGIVADGDARWLSVIPHSASGVSHPEPLIRTDRLRIFGSHNWANALAALALADAAGIPRDASLAALAEFGGLPHRCEFVAEVRGVAYFNDSKGTNVGSTLAALNGLPGPLLWLGGGQGKGQDFTELARPLADKGRAAILFGQDAERIENDVFGALPVYREATMRDALERARALAEKGDRVLLSPACASFDQFRNYEDRGAQFREQVRAWAA